MTPEEILKHYVSEDKIKDPHYIRTYKHGFIEGFEKALNLNKDKVYNEEEVRLMLSEAFKASQEGYNITANEIIEQFKNL